jgi:hypothetical protein
MTSENSVHRQLAERLRDASVPALLTGAQVNDRRGAWWVVDAEQRVLVSVDGRIRRTLRPGDEQCLRLDLSAGATRGALLAWLRARYALPTLTVRAVGGPMDGPLGPPIWWAWAVCGASFFDLPTGDSEAEALVAAAEALRSGAREERPLPAHRLPAPPLPPKRQRAAEVPDVG